MKRHHQKIFTPLYNQKIYTKYKLEMSHKKQSSSHRYSFTAMDDNLGFSNLVPSQTPTV